MHTVKYIHKAKKYKIQIGKEGVAAMLKSGAALDVLAIIMVGLMLVNRISSGFAIGSGIVNIVIISLLILALVFMIKRIRQE